MQFNGRTVPNTLLMLCVFM